MMKYIINTLGPITILAGLLLTIVSCGGPAERIRETSARPATPAPTPSERLISGSFNINGAGENEREPYSGLLTIAPKGDIYEFRWTTTRGSRMGTGVQIGDSVAASFAATGGGAGCGAVLFRIAVDGTLDGKITRWGEEKFATEKATRVEGTGFIGKYTVAGVGGDETPYSGDLTVKKDGGGYDLEWKIDGRQLVGFGTWKGSVAAASFGGRQCGFALYDIRSNGNLDGNWGSQKAVTFGTETAKRQ
ncbi:MAG: hypothetical protein AB7J13_00820 [Pyrinomonadaceae bacterium]